MSRSYTLSPEEISWSRSRGNIEISASAERSVLSNPIGRAYGRGFKKGDEEEPIRKRIRVACSRCRRRKIKCSGPIGGEDQPCLNCKNAGADTYCAFELTGSVKVDLGNFRQFSRDYLYGMADTTTGSLPYSNDFSGPSLADTMLQYSAPSQSGSFTQRIPPPQAYTPVYGGGQDYREYGHHAGAYGIGSSYPISETMMQNPSQSHAILSNQEHLSSWNLGQHDGGHPYSMSTRPISGPPPSTVLSASILQPTQAPSALSTTISATTDCPLPSPAQILSPGSISGSFLLSDARERLYWPNGYDSQTDAGYSRTSSQQTSSSRSSATHSSLFDQGVDASTELGRYTTLPSSTVDDNLPLVATTDVVHQNLSSSQQLASDKYQYHYSTLKPTLLPMAASNSTIYPASMASIGNQAFTPSPYRPSDEHGTSKCQPDSTLRNVPSRIVMQIANPGGRRVVEKL